MNLLTDSKYRNECEQRLDEEKLDGLMNSFKNITNEIITDNLTAEELQIRSEEIQKIMLGMMKLKESSTTYFIARKL